jgi:hypothetical protein
MGSTKAAATIGLALASLAAAAQGSAPATSVERSERIAPGDVVEWCADLAKGQRASYRFEADAPLDFNIHAHESDKVIYPVKRNGQRRAGPARFSAPSASEWCWMWTNGGKKDAEVRYTVTVEPPR